MKSLLRRRRARAWLAGTLLAVSLPSCGGGSTGPTVVPTPQPTPTPCTQTQVGIATGAVPAETVAGVDFTTTAAGRIDVTLDWTFPTSPIGMYLFRANTCDFTQFNSCPFLIRSDPTTVKPRRASAENQPAGAYELIVVNFSDRDESLAGQIVLSQGSCPAIGGIPSGPATTTFRSLGRLGR
jgi:hypothetical protein